MPKRSLQTMSQLFVRPTTRKPHESCLERRCPERRCPERRCPERSPKKSTSLIFRSFILGVSLVTIYISKQNFLFMGVDIGSNENNWARDLQEVHVTPGPFETSKSNLGQEAFQAFENKQQAMVMTPDLPQLRAEIANNQEEIRFITNMAAIKKKVKEATERIAHSTNTRPKARWLKGVTSDDTTPTPFVSHIIEVRVLATEPSFTKSLQEKWASILEEFAKTLPSMVMVRVKIVEPPFVLSDVLSATGPSCASSSNSNKKSTDKTPVCLSTHNGNNRESMKSDWIMTVQDFTYVNLARLSHRLFAQIDPMQPEFHGLLKNQTYSLPNGGEQISVRVPMMHAGMLMTRVGIERARGHHEAGKCWHESQDSSPTIIAQWTACLAASKSPFSWTPMPGLNPFDPSWLAKNALEGNIFREDYMDYSSVGGIIEGTARLPITYGRLLNPEYEKAFHSQLLVDTNQARVPKIFHQLWVGPKNNLDSQSAEAAEECRRMHEANGWQYILWDKEKIAALPGVPAMTSMFDTEQFHFYADTMRYYILYKFGGVYSDIDAACVRPFDAMIDYVEEKKVDLLTSYESQWYTEDMIANGVLIAAPQSQSLMAMMLHLGHELTKYRPNFTNALAWTVSGPMCPTKTYKNWKSWTQEKMAVLTNSAFIPVHYRDFEVINKRAAVDLARRQGSYTVQYFRGASNLRDD